MSFPIFEGLFGSKVRARLVRFFILNPTTAYATAEISEKTLLSRSDIARDILKLKKMSMLKESTRKGVKTYQLHSDFPFYTELKSLVVKSNSDIPRQMFKKFRTAGDVKLILISGMFLNNPKSKADMVLVINNAHRVKLKQSIEKLEAEIGQEVRFVVMDTDELHYRLNMLDRFLIEFMEGPYQEVLNRLPELKRFVAGLKR
ncbi:MAG: hypothetical protein HGA31_03365 [Candidatus Moranbacteria bacterium]|nr:hypothetical protein [Candidatus Moranbacteria bacterium]